MVGVSTSLGCTACRQQKKKCIADGSQPPCQRCKRLRIDCLELGQRRLKFQSENDRLALLVKQGDNLKPAVFNSTAVTKCYRFAKGNYLDTAGLKFASNRNESLIPKSISSALTRLQAGYVRIVDTKVDIAEQLPWNFGPYLEQVPLYLGRSKAFDASAEALIESYSCLKRRVCSGQDDRALARYSKALKALQSSLSNANEATSTETLASIGMLMIFESMAGFGPKSILTHAGGAARVYKERGQMMPKNEFEAMLQLSLRGAIVMQALFLPSDYFTELEWAALTQSQIGADSPEERAFRCFAVYARLLHTVAPLLCQQQPSQNQGRLKDLKNEAEALKQCLDIELEALRQTFWYLTRILIGNDTLSEGARRRTYPDTSGTNTYHAHIGRSYGFALGNKVLINSMIGAINERLDSSEMSSDDTYPMAHQDLMDENADLARECCHLARAVDCHRPLGTIYMPGTLRFVSVGARGKVRDPVKALSTQKFQSPAAFHANIIATFAGQVKILEQQTDVQDLMASKSAIQPCDDLTVLEEISVLIARFSSDFGDVMPSQEMAFELMWLKMKFTFADVDSDFGKAAMLSQSSGDSPSEYTTSSSG